MCMHALANIAMYVSGDNVDMLPNSRTTCLHIIMRSVNIVTPVLRINRYSTIYCDSLQQSYHVLLHVSSYIPCIALCCGGSFTDGQLLQGTSDLLNNFPGSLTSVEMLLRYDTYTTLKVYR